MNILTIILCLVGLCHGTRVDPETTTLNGDCYCDAECRASDHDAFVSDWCPTKNACGFQVGKNSQVTNGTQIFWDYCAFKDSYTEEADWDWKDKYDQLWCLLQDDPTIGPGNDLMKLFSQSLKTSFHCEWDFMPAGRVKYSHAQGIVCPVKIDIDKKSPFTGLLKANSKQEGFIRLSGSADELSPGIGLKLMRSRAMSGDVLALNSFVALKDFNFFSVPLTNNMIVPPGIPETPAIIAFRDRICQSGYCAAKTGLSNLCAIDQDGCVEEQVEFPFKITFEPGKSMSMDASKPKDEQEFLSRMIAAIPTGSELYKLKAQTDPNDKVGVDLGMLVTTDDCITSFNGDTKLFFRHQDLEEDIALKPQWADALREGCICNPSPPKT